MSAADHPVWDYPGRPLRAVIDLDRIASNYRALQILVGNGVKVIAMVKANAYGHGAIGVARRLVEAGCGRFGVATVEEGLQLRGAGIKVAIMVFGPPHPSEVEAAMGARLELTIATKETLELVSQAIPLLRSWKQPSIHLKIDTGLRRYGASHDLALSLARTISERGIRLTSVYTHFATADEPDLTQTHSQREQFAAFLALLKAYGIDFQFSHASNSAATLSDERFHFGAVRTGISLYGIAPANHLSLPTGSKPALQLLGLIGRVSRWPQESGVGYGVAYMAHPGELLGLAPIGYADGYQRSLSNQAWMSVNGHKAPVRGRISMDQTVIGLDDCSYVKVGDEVIVAGDGANGEPTFTELAAIAGTISYELLATLDRRIPRFYMAEGRVCAKEDLAGYQILS